ncbi:helix-turn-helix transcriptional regulator [Nocardiopsis sp. NPDC058631]|uniref:helix-turn-helix transcriptional regulator n=1 Tax=Nocardiopsis sp. NPDC058631 TaxID=3346566 RepID=UPI003666AB4B
MIETIGVASGEDFSVASVTCRNDHRRWSDPEVRDHHGMVLVRRGRFRRSHGGESVDVDPTLAYLAEPGAEERFAHPDGGDACTSIVFSPGLWQSMTDGEPGRVTRSAVYVDARIDLAHRRTLAAAPDVGYAVAEELVLLLRGVVEQVVAAPPAHPSPARDRALVAGAREAIGEGHRASAALIPLAGLLGVSPYRLSRAFTRETGVSLTRYRNRVRVGRALDRLEGGEESLAVLAADLGFADQAHLCRTVREHVGHTPTSLRTLLAGDGPGSTRRERTWPARSGNAGARGFRPPEEETP